MEDTITGVEFYSNVKTSEVEWICMKKFENVEYVELLFNSVEKSVETMIRDGYRLSYRALDSRRNSGLKMMFFVLYLARTLSVYPTGIVEFPKQKDIKK